MYVCESVHVRERVCVCERERERERMCVFGGKWGVRVCGGKWGVRVCGGKWQSAEHLSVTAHHQAVPTRGQMRAADANQVRP